MFHQSVHGLTIHAISGHRCVAVLIAACLMAGVAGAPVAGQTSPPHSLVGDGKYMPSDPAIEAAFNRQRALMVKALAEIAPSRPNVAEFFFVGFAGRASEDVFLNEVRAAADLFRRRFGADGRTMLLANNAKTTKELPFASVSSLGVALREIAAKMGNEDVLFLYLSSHGQRGRLSVRNGRIDFPDLRATHLRRILDMVGIKNRVLAISACYSGSFIEKLKDDNTLIMTASAPDRVSFGCGHDGTFTYFGQALIGEALENETSFRRAFEMAATIIEKREKGEGREPSIPQFLMGEAIEPVLERIARQLSGNR